MARMARIVANNVPHHVTQRGNARQFLLETDAERAVYLELLRGSLQLYPLKLLGYCLMSNHVHLIVLPREPSAMSLALKQTHGRYAAYWNGSHRSSGHVWQGRFYSCPMDSAHLWMAMRYVELNPVRAGLASEAASWKWSSAGVHCGGSESDANLDLELWERRWSSASWREYLEAEETESERLSIRRCTHTGRPLGNAEFIQSLEDAVKRRLAPSKGGRPKTRVSGDGQQELVFEN